MLAVDTNVIVRCIVADDPKQSARARTLVTTERIHVSKTVVLETSWVLRRSYGFTAHAVADALRSFFGLPNVELETPRQVDLALTWSEQGMDLADAIHLAASDRCDAMISFDTGFAKIARKVGVLEVRSP